MKGPLRRTMIWLHTWSGLLLSWLLFAVFVTGTLAFFRVEITHWMQPERHISGPAENAPMVAYQRLTATAPFAESWDISLPEGRSNMTSLRWTMPGEQVERRRGPRAVIDSNTGEIIEPRDTAGGQFLFQFHYRLYNLGRDPGQFIVGVAAMFMLIAIISGVIMHRKIFTDFFSFRTQKRTIGWLDAHAVVAVLALPFHFIITFTGLMLVAGSLLFWMEDGRGGRGGQGQAQVQTAVTERVTPGAREGMNRSERPTDNAASRSIQREANRERTQHNVRGEEASPGGGRSMPNRERITQRATGIGAGNQVSSRAGNGPRTTSDRAVGAALESQTEGARHGQNRGSRQALERPKMLPPVEVPLPAMIAKAEQVMGEAVARIQVDKPMRAEAEYRLSAAYPESITGGRRARETAYFDGNGNFLKVETSENTSSAVQVVNSTLRALHEALFADYLGRWLFFIAGIMGSVMVASGAVLWVVKRARGQLGQFGYELTAGLNVGNIAGFCCAVAAYFWANRLIPADQVGRAEWEINVFFAVWLTMAIHGLIFRHRIGWVMQLGTAAVLFLALPLLDSLTSPVNLMTALQATDWQRISFDIVSWLTGVALAWTAYRISRVAPSKNKKRIKPSATTLSTGVKA